MIVANLGVSIPVFVLGLLLAYFFAVTLRGTPFSLPPSGLLSAGVRHEDLAVIWGMEGVEGFPRTILDFMSNMTIISSLISGQWEPLLDGAEAHDPADGGARNDPDGDHRPHDALEHARRPGPRLHPDRPRQGRLASGS